MMLLEQATVTQGDRELRIKILIDTDEVNFLVTDNAKSQTQMNYTIPLTDLRSGTSFTLAFDIYYHLHGKVGTVNETLPIINLLSMI